MSDWKVQVNRNEGVVEVRQGTSIVRFHPDDAREVGEQVIDAAWNLDRAMFRLEVAAVGRFWFECEGSRDAFKVGVEAMGGECREVQG